MLEMQSISKSYGSKQVLSNASFHMRKGEIAGVMGPSGEGKSTIARILCGTVAPDSGSVFFENELLTKAGQSFNKKLRTAIQLIPQQPFASLDPRQTVGKAIEEPLLFHRIVKSRAEAKSRALSLMERMLLDRRLYERRPGELSGGQAQRVLIVRSLTVSPRLLIADEATSMLDVSAQSEVMRLLTDLSRQDGLAVLIISHDDTLVKSMADTIYRLSNGKLTNAKQMEETQ